jgi:hypothetical protein
MFARLRPHQAIEQQPQFLVHLTAFDENASHGSILSLN